MMRFVADSNVIFTYLWESSALREIIHQGARLFSPEYALLELEEHWQEIAGKAGVRLEERDGLLHSLRQKVEIVPKSGYEKFLPEAERLASAFTGKEEADLRDDADFLALAMLLDCPLWSNDKLLKRQSKVAVLSTQEVIALFKPEKPDRGPSGEIII
ncbi:MAG: PIN domain-containing protein [Candidatus Micrarchaeia archaeon]